MTDPTLETLQERLARVAAERDAALVLLRELEWSAEVYAHDDPSNGCPVCGQAEWVGHAPDCALAALLEGAGE